MQNENPTPKKAKPGLILFLLAIVFIGPFLFAWSMFQRSDSIQFNTVNNGDLINPAIPVESFHLKTPFEQTPAPRKEFKGHWTVIYLLPKICSAGCHENLFNMKQMHTALGKEMSRVKRAYFFLPNQVNKAECKLYHDTYPNVPQWVIHANVLAELKTHNPHYEKVGTYYIVDPMGHIMMSYEGDMPMKAIMNDIKRLLKVSKIG